MGVRSTYEESISIKNVSFLQLLTCVVVCTSRQYDRRKFVIFRLAKLCLFLRYHLPAHYDIRFIMLRASVRLANITIYLFHKRAKYLHLFLLFFFFEWLDKDLHLHLWPFTLPLADKLLWKSWFAFKPRNYCHRLEVAVSPIFSVALNSKKWKHLYR